MRAAVLGAGAWGTTFAAVLADAGCEVMLWGRDPAVAEEIAATRRNERFVPGVDLPAGVVGTSDAGLALGGAELVAVALPSNASAASSPPSPPL